MGFPEYLHILPAVPQVRRPSVRAVPALTGALRGLVTNASLIAGVAGAGADRQTIALVGIAGLAAGAFTLSAGGYFGQAKSRITAPGALAPFVVGALIPLWPYLVGLPVLALALVPAGVIAVVGGAVVAKLSARPMLAGCLRQFAAVFFAAGMAFTFGHLIS